MAGQTNTRQVREIMESDPVLISPDATLREAALKMKEVNCGFLPVGTNDQPQGIITDRDIVIRAISEGKNPDQERVRDYMSKDVCSCREVDTLEDAAKMMNENGISRLVVKDSSGSISGVLTFGHIIRSDNDREEVRTVVECATGKAA